MKSVVFSPDGKTLATASSDNTVRLWSSSDATIIKKLQGHTERVLSVAFSPDGKMLASGSGDETVRLWNIDSGNTIDTLVGHTHCGG